jgi:hypothetical protein
MSHKRRQRRAARPSGVIRKPQARAAGRIGERVRRIMHVVTRQHPLAVAAALAGLHVVLGLLTFAPQPHTGGDNAAYVALAQSLVERGTYTELWDPLTPPHTKYPPVFPGVLTLALLAGLKPWVQLKFVVLGLSALATAFTFLFIRARNRPLLALGVAAIIALAPGVLREGRWLLSDVPFWAFTMIALWAFERLRPGDWKRFAVAATAALLAYFTRTAGLPLVLAALAFLVWRRNWKQLGALIVIVGVPALLWWMRSRAYGPSGYVSEFWLVDPYAPHLGRAGPFSILGRIVENGWKYMSMHLPVLLTGTAGRFTVAVSIAIFALGIGGWIARLKRPRVAELFVPAYVGLIVIWPPVWSGERFLLPLLPLLLFYAGELLVRLLRRVTPRVDFAAAATGAALLLLLALPGLVESARTGRACTALYRAGERYPCLGSPAWDDLFHIAEAAGTALPDDAIVINRKPRLFFGLGGVRGSIYPFTSEPAAFFAVLDSVGARYVVLDRLGTGDAYLVPIILRKPAAFCLMHARPASGTILMGIRPDHAQAPDLGEAGLRAAATTAFETCDTTYWRDAAGMDVLGAR